jgi:streptogramin lyase
LSNIDERLRSSLHAAGRVSPPAVDSAAIRFLRRRRTRNVRWGSAALMTVIVVVAAGAFAVRSIADSNLDGTPAAPGTELSITANVTLASPPAGLSVGEGWLWVATTDGALLRIDPMTGELTGEVRLGSHDGRWIGTVATGEGAVWVTGRNCTIFKIDPNSVEVTGTAQVAGCWPFVVDDGLAWAGQGADDDGKDDFMVGMDASSLKPRVEAPTGACCMSDAAVSHGSLWVARQDVGSTPISGSGQEAVLPMTLDVLRIDPRSGETTARVEFEGDRYQPGDTVLGSVEAIGNEIWIARPEAAVIERIDPKTLVLGDAIELPDVRLPDHLTPSGDVVWAHSLNRSTLVRIEAQSGEPLGEPLDAGFDISDIAATDDGSLWVIPSEGSSIRKLELGRESSPAPRPTATISPSPNVLQPNEVRLGRPEDVADARAITVAFHALLSTVGYNLDYKSFERTPEGWVMSYIDGMTVRDLEGSIDARRGEIEDTRSAILEDERELEAVSDELSEARALGDEVRIDELSKSLNGLREAISESRSIIVETQQELIELATELQDTQEQGGPFPVEITVKEQDGRLVVTAVDGPFTEDETARIEGYSEAISEIESDGNEYYNIDLTREGETSIQASGFWTGAIPSPYKEKCLFEIVDATGTVVWEQSDVHNVIDDAPPSEDRRDGWDRGIIGFKDGIEDSQGEMEGRSACSPVP